MGEDFWPIGHMTVISGINNIWVATGEERSVRIHMFVYDDDSNAISSSENVVALAPFTLSETEGDVT